MMTSIVSTTQLLFQLSILLACQLLIILLARKFFGTRLGAINTYRLWLLPLLSLPLLVPDWPALNISIFSDLIPEAQNSGPGKVAEISSLAGAMPRSGWERLLTNSSLTNFWLLLATIWLAGSLRLLFTQCIKIKNFMDYVHSRKQALDPEETKVILGRSGFDRSVEMFFLEGLSSPAVYGILKPVLLLPVNFFADYREEQRTIILAHEATHLARRDNIFNMLVSAIKVLLWINPLVHYSYRYFRLDQETSCDAMTLNKCDARQAKLYTITLLETVKNAATFNDAPMLTAWDNLHEIKERTAMMKLHKQSLSTTMSGKIILSLVIAAGCFITAAYSSSISRPVFAGERDHDTSVSSSDNEQMNEIIVNATIKDRANVFAKLVYSLTPEYPQKAMNSSVEGWNLIEFEVTPQGNVVNAQVVDSNPAETFDQASLNAISQFKYSPAIKNGKAVTNTEMRTVFRYTLDNNQRN